MTTSEIVEGNCIDTLKQYPDNHFDSIVTDPPYGLSFMGAKWDKAVPGPEYWAELLRVAKPGAYLLAFGAPRLYHRMAVAIEDAGWEIRDCLQWWFYSGFPKSHNIANDIDKRLGHPPRGKAIPVASTTQVNGDPLTGNRVESYQPRSNEAAPWTGWGTALKPAYEPIILARKPIRTTVAENVMKYGTGGLNIDACRVAADSDYHDMTMTQWSSDLFVQGNRENGRTFQPAIDGRWPSNVIVDELVADDLGEAAKYFYCPKASKKEKDAGLSGFPLSPPGSMSGNRDGTLSGTPVTARNHHSTVKPLALMRYLCRLITPTDGHILDPFAGSGSTGCAARLEGFRFTGLELDPEYARIARARISHWEQEADDQ
jgi:hypothetical protein